MSVPSFRSASLSALTVVAVTASFVGSNMDSSGGQIPANDPVAASQLHALADRTIGASSFTERIRVSGNQAAGSESLIYNAPDRVEVLSPTSHQATLIGVGRYQYTLGLSGPGWGRMKVPRLADGETAVLANLKALAHASNVSSSGDVFIATFISTEKIANHAALKTTVTVHAENGHLSKLTILERTSDPTWDGHTLDIRFSDFDDAPKIKIPASHPVSASPSKAPATP